MERIELPRLTRHDTGELVVRILGRQPASDLADALYHRSEGNPLFIEALLCCDGELSQELPESLRDLLLDSVRRLPEDTQEVLRVASAGGESTAHALLGAVTGLDDAALTRTVRPAVIANVLHTRGDGYAFRHELIREAVHEDLLPGEHGRLHSRFAEAIDADPTLVPPGRAAIEMAHHWYSAHDSTWALIAAGRRRRRRAARSRPPSGFRCWPACSNCGIRCRTPPNGSPPVTARSWKKPLPRPMTPGSSNAGSRWPPRRSRN